MVRVVLLLLCLMQVILQQASVGLRRPGNHNCSGCCTLCRDIAFFLGWNCFAWVVYNIVLSFAKHVQWSVVSMSLYRW